MAIYCVTYDLTAPEKNYSALFDYLNTFPHCKKMESLWFIDTIQSITNIRDDLKSKVYARDTVFVAKLQRIWAASNFDCADWLNKPDRNW